MDSTYMSYLPTETERYEELQPVIPPMPPSAETLASRALGERIVAHSGRLSASTCRWLLMVAEFDDRNGAEAFGLPTTSAWLAYSCGLTRRTAIEHVRVARKLAAFPELAEEMSAGRLSYSQVRAISRALTIPAEAADAEQRTQDSAPAVQAQADRRNPDRNTSADAPESLVDAGAPPDGAAATAVARPLPRIRQTAVNPATDYTLGLINLARSGTAAQLESVVRGLRTVATIGAAEAGAPLPERVGIGWNADGTWRLSARLHPERGTVIESALTRIGERESLNREDALIRLAEVALAHLNDGGGSEDLPALRGEDRASIVIHLDADRIPQSVASGAPNAPAARIADGPGLPDEVALRLMCDGRVRTVAVCRAQGHEQHVLDVGRSHRLATKRQRRVLMIRHGGRCGHPGCSNRKGLEAHHVIHWLHGGGTDIGNLVLLCPRHHHLHHDGAFTITAAPGGRFTFALGDGTPLPEAVDASALIAGAPPVESEHPDVAPRAATAQWLGDRLDRAYAVSVLAQQRPPAA